MLPKEDGIRFLRLARETVSGILNGKHYDDSFLKEKYQEPRGVFVTLKKDGDLRGCIGFPEPVLPLYDAVKEAAKEAAFGDPRFPEIDSSEFPHLEFEISVLTVPKPILASGPDEILKNITIGQDGLIIRGRSSGLLLPQVATEWHLSPERFLEALSQKAGLHKDAWKDRQNRLFTFQAQIFMEK